MSILTRILLSTLGVIFVGTLKAALFAYILFLPGTGFTEAVSQDDDPYERYYLHAAPESCGRASTG